MAIHHYTKAENLPLILESGNFRFTRADCLDDKSEMPFQTAHIDPKYFFISSWTYKPGEHSGQWYRYGDAHAGVQITLPDMPFDFETVNLDLSRDCLRPENAGKKVGFQIDAVSLPYTKCTMFGNGYLLYPLDADMKKHFGGKVVYDADPSQYVKRFISTSPNETVITGGAQLGRIKSQAWADQMEYRFILTAILGPRFRYAEYPREYEEALFEQFENLSSPFSAPDITFIDLPLSKEALGKLIVTLGSNIRQEDRDSVIHALKNHAPNAKVMESSIAIR